MKTKPYDVVDYLHSEGDIQAYLQEMLASGASSTAIKYAFMDAERARAKLANQDKSKHFGHGLGCYLAKETMSCLM